MAKREQEKVGFGERLKQIGLVFKITAQQDRWFLPLLIGAVLVTVALTVLLVVLAGWLWLPLGLMLTLLAVLIVLNLRSGRVFMRLAEQQPGAAAAVLERMRGGWRVTPAVASTTQMDMVHLAVSRRGVVLIGEGAPHRVKPMLAQEKRRLAKVVGTAPIYDFVLGHGEGQVPLSRINFQMSRLRPVLSAQEVSALNRRLQALAARPRMPRGAIPKDFIPRNLRPPRSALRGR